MRELIASKIDLKALQALDPQGEVASSPRAVDQGGVASPSNDAATKALQALELPSGVAPPPGSERKRKFLLDDVPASIKRSRLQERPSSGLKALQTVAMNFLVHTDGHEWLDNSQLAGLSALLRRQVLGVRLHAESRRRLFDHPRHKVCNRLSVMLTEDATCKFKDDGTERQDQK